MSLTVQDQQLGPGGPDPGPRAPAGWGWARWFWRTLRSMRTAVILLALLAAAAVPGSLLPQRGVASDPVAVPTFAADHPDLYPWLDRLWLFEVYASPWFAAIYLLLLVSMTGCVLPRCAQLWRAVRTAPPAAPRHLGRFAHHQQWRTPVERSGEQLATAAAALRRRRYRVVVTETEVRAERGYVREVGNLVFHLSLLVLLVGIGAGRLFGFEGRIALAEGDTFTNVSSSYDAFTPSVWTDTDNLEPFSFTLEDFQVRYAMDGPQRGDPREFKAAVSYTSEGSEEPQRLEVRPNHPLNINGTKAFLTGHGYAPVVTVRDGRGEVVSSGTVIFLPLDGSYTSDGVIKAPDAQPTQMGFRGLLLPTAANGVKGPYSAFPDALNPRLVLTPFLGDLGLESGPPQSVYELDTADMEPVTDKQGKPVVRALGVGDTLTLPGGAGSITFDRLDRFANFQIAHDPGKEISLVAGVLLLVGLTTSLAFRRRRVWVRLDSDGDGTNISIGGQSLTRWPMPPNDIHDVVAALGQQPRASEE